MRFASRHFVILTLTGFWVLPAHSAVNVQTRTTPANSTYLLNETATHTPRDSLFFGLDYNFLHEPLVKLIPSRERRLNTLLDHVQTLDATAGLTLLKQFSLNTTVPLHLVKPSRQGQEFALGDIRIFAKAELLQKRLPFHVSIVPELRFPTGDSEHFLSESSLGWGMLLAVEHDLGLFSAVANIGYRYSAKAVFNEMDYRHKIPFSFGVSIPMTSKWAMNAEASSFRTLPLNSYQNPSELYAGLRYEPMEATTLTGGVSAGSTNRVASADFRAIFGLKFTPTLNREIATDQVVVTQAQSKPASERLEIPEEVLFNHNSAELLPTSGAILNTVASLIQQNDSSLSLVDIEGHCNELGSDAYNLTLSTKRAASVYRYLVQIGVRAALLQKIGYGKRRPKIQTEGMTRTQWLKTNRRVEFKIVK
jgi:outer membrane protein OmpA-like peptidoglycan-associated protein